jgi:two-component system nitrate/nitrite response regulator NarL
MNPIKIMIVEDHPQYREVIELALAEEPTLELTGKFGAAEVALRNLQDPTTRYPADLLLLDLNLPGMSGLEAIPWFRKYAPDLKIIILSQSNKEADILSAIQSGAAGYLLKSASIEEITQGIQTVMDGGASLDPQVAKFIVKALQAKPTPTDASTDITPRESEILALLSEGLVKKEIAEKLGIGIHTVAEHVKRIYIKLDVSNAPAAVSKAYKTGLFPTEN